MKKKKNENLEGQKRASFAKFKTDDLFIHLKCHVGSKGHSRFF